jgi:hypothetical protein
MALYGSVLSANCRNAKGNVYGTEIDLSELL